MSLGERFWSKVEKTDSCWEWLGAKTAGYGAYMYNGLARRAFRLAWEETNGPVPPRLELDHLCRNRACVNPAHLEPVTPHENWRRGESLPAQNARRTHCVHGHPLTPDNTYTPPKQPTWRYCLTCRDERNHARYAQAVA